MAVDLDLTGWTQQASPPTYDGNYPTSVRPEADDLWTAVVPIGERDNPGLLSFWKSLVVLPGAGTAQILIHRLGGSLGSASCLVETFDIVGDCSTASGLDYTAVSQTVSFADGEVGVKVVEVPVLRLPRAGKSKIGVRMTTPVGAEIYHPRMHIHIDDGNPNPNATIVTNVTMAEMETVANAATAGDLIYVRAATLSYNNLGPSQARGGYAILNGSGTESAPIELAVYPGETVLIDQLNAGSASSNNTTCGFVVGSPTKFFTISGFDITRTSNSGIYCDNGGTNDGMIFENLNIYNLCDQNVADNGNNVEDFDNVGAIRADFLVDPIVRGCTVDRIYDPRSTSNTINAIPRGLHAGLHGFRPKAFWSHNNTISVVQRGVYGKYPTQEGGVPQLGHHTHHNLFYDVAEFAHDNGTSGGGVIPYKKIMFHHNVALLDAATAANVCLVSIGYGDDVIQQPDILYVFNNTEIGGKHIVRAKTMAGIVAYNNIGQNMAGRISMDLDLTYNNRLEYEDFNNYNGSTVDYQTMRNSPGSITYSTLASWQGAFAAANPQLNRAMGGTTTSDAPVYVDSPGGDYRTVTGPTVDSGRFGRTIGIENEEVGA